MFSTDYVENSKDRRVTKAAKSCPCGPCAPVGKTARQTAARLSHGPHTDRPTTAYQGPTTKRKDQSSEQPGALPTALPTTKDLTPPGEAPASIRTHVSFCFLLGISVRVLALKSA